MIEEKNNNEIVFTELIRKIWKSKSLYLKVMPTVLVLSYLIICFIPRYYVCTVALAPEAISSGGGGSLGSLASSFGLGSIGKIGASIDAINAEIYPDLLKSNDFIAKLMPVKVESKDGKIKCNYYTYRRDKQGVAFWNVVMGKVHEMINPTPKDKDNGEEEIDVFSLTKQQSDIFKGVQADISCSVDKKTDVITITVTDQDPKICATMANATCRKLQDFIVGYRTHKAQIDYEYYKKLRAESKASYDQARRKYAAYADANDDVTLLSVKSVIDDLENEMQLKYNIYTSMNTQLQVATAKLQEQTPAFTVIQSATIPNKPAGPKRLMLALTFMILSFFVVTLFVWRDEFRKLDIVYLKKK